MANPSKTAFEGLVRAYSSELYRFAYWLTRDRFSAEDLVQETFARAWSAWQSLREQGAAKSWLYMILRNEHARLFERRRLDIVEDQDLDALEDQRIAAPSTISKFAKRCMPCLQHTENPCYCSSSVGSVVTK